MTFYEEQGKTSPEEPRTTVYHTGNGFYDPYVEPLWKREKRLVRGAGNGIGAAALGYVFFSLLAGIVYAVLIQLFFPLANIHGFLYVTETTEWLFNLGIYTLSLLIPFGIYALIIKIPLRIAIPFRKAKADLTFGGLLIGLGFCVVASYATAYLQTGLEAVGIGITMPEYETPETLPGIIIYFITMSIAPAFIEEIIFRGIVMQSLRRFGDIFALVSSALIFGIFHLNLIQMPYAFIMGLCIGYFVMRTGSLWVGVLIHFINNGTVVVLELAYPYIGDEMYYLANTVFNLVSVVLAVVALIFILSKYKDMFRFEPSRSVLPSGKRTLTFITSPVLIIAILAAVVLTLPYIYLI